MNHSYTIILTALLTATLTTVNLQAGAVTGFTTYGGSWLAKEGVLSVSTESGAKLIADIPVFEPVTTAALRVEVQLQPDWSGRILEWKAD